MLMVHRLFISVALLVVGFVGRGQVVSAEMGKVRLSFSLDRDGVACYAVSFGGRAVVKPSRMGFRLDKDTALYKGFSLLGIDSSSHDEIWQPVWGEVSHIRDHYRQLV